MASTQAGAQHLARANPFPLYCLRGHRRRTAGQGVLVKSQKGDGQGAQAAGHALVGQRYLLTLDIGRERHTWMAPEWAASGRRVEVPVAVAFEAGGAVRPLGVGAFSKLKVGPGEWQQQDDTLRFWLLTDGLSRGDVTLPAGKLFISVPAWGSMLSKDKGTLTIKQTRWLVRVESRLVGRLRVTRFEEGESVEAALGPAKMKSGSLEGPLYYGGNRPNE